MKKLSPPTALCTARARQFAPPKPSKPARRRPAPAKPVKPTRPKTPHAEQIARLDEITHPLWNAEQRRNGAALFYLPDDESGQPRGPARLISSPAVRAWIIKRYTKQHGAAPDVDALRSWTSEARFMSYCPARTRKRASRRAI